MPLIAAFIYRKSMLEICKKYIKQSQRGADKLNQQKEDYFGST
jgi:hypothetical protein